MIESDQPLSRYCELVGLRRLAILRGDEETAAALMAKQRERAEAKRRKYWGQWKAGDGVLLSAGKSAELKKGV